VTKPVRDRLKEDLEARYEKLLEVIEGAMDQKKQYPVWCTHCKHRAFMEVPDLKMAMQAAEFFANQGLGRPGVAEAAGEEKSFSFVNKITYAVADAN
jgi:hypothetical protein